MAQFGWEITHMEICSAGLLNACTTTGWGRPMLPPIIIWYKHCRANTENSLCNAKCATTSSILKNDETWSVRLIRPCRRLRGADQRVTLTGSCDYFADSCKMFFMCLLWVYAVDGGYTKKKLFCMLVNHEFQKLKAWVYTILYIHNLKLPT